MTYLNKITFHWTGGRHMPSEHEKECYHFLIDKDGVTYKGTHKPLDNVNCNDGKYAAHTGGGNTGNIGIAFCGCYVPKGVPVQKTAFPLKRIQLEAGFKLAAMACKHFNIPIDKEHVFTHYEFGLTHPDTSSAGKIDITYMHPFPEIKADKVGEFIRGKVKWYYKNL
jgi:hypothetical protein